jgi:hypothetical protein
MSEPSKAGTGSSGDLWQGRLAAYRTQILDKALIGVPLGLVAAAVDWIVRRLISQPWESAFAVVPLALLAWLAARGVARRALVVDRRYLLFLGLYVLAFSAAASGTFLDWNRRLVLFEERAPRSWLLPSRFGDWRYAVARKWNPPPLAVVLLAPATGRSQEAARLELVQLIAASERAGALGVAFDFYLEGRTALDPLLCQVVKQATIPVYFGYAFRSFGGAKELQSCLGDERLGHLGAFADHDGVVRLIPMYFGNQRRPALSLRVAQTLAGKDWSPPAHGTLLRFTQPARDYWRVSFQALVDRPSDVELLHQRFVLVGEDSASDSFPTPYGRRPGVLVHADAIYSLVKGASLRASPWWLGLVYSVVSCYLITSLAARGAAVGKLVLWCTALTAGLGLLAVVLAALAGWWFEIAYPLAAVWFLLPLALAFRKRTLAPVSGPPS